VLAFDIRGHGKSGMPYDPQAYGRETAVDLLDTSALIALTSLAIRWVLS